MRHVRIHIRGVVQGVGMRPFVYREAVAHGVSGWVLNAGDGVRIEAHAEEGALEAFVHALRDHAPAAARVESVEVAELDTDDGGAASAEAAADEPGALNPSAGRSASASASKDRTPEQHDHTFRIVASDAGAERTTLVSPDIATCPDCLRELFDPADRRFHYPFINCTNCGPRFTIIRSLPYDRAATSMDAFPMCPECAHEYADPSDRRFHAQPDACFACGPHITWRERDRRHGRPRTMPQVSAGDSQPVHQDATTKAAFSTKNGLINTLFLVENAAFVSGAGKDGTKGTRIEPDRSASAPPFLQAPSVGRTLEESDGIIERCAELLADGGIVAIKGLGGFHLACDAGNEDAVRMLRQRKRRSNKPFAIMARTLETVQGICEVDPVERQILTGAVRPIVLLKRLDTNAKCRMDAKGPAAVSSSSAPKGTGAATPTGNAGQSDTTAQFEATTGNASVIGTGNAAGATSHPSPAARLAIAPSVAFDLPELGIMLPYTPLQHLLLAACAKRGIRALVMTSGNLSGEPIETDDGLAWERLVETGVADALLGNDRPILSRYDDSVVRVVDGRAQMVRRARGYAPRPIGLPQRGTDAVETRPLEQGIPSAGIAPQPLCVLACGSEQKATLAFTRERADGTANCFLSQHIGDVESGGAFDAWHAARTRFQSLFGMQPTALACDLHPRYLSSQWTREQARLHGIPLVEVQHHHAHIASVIAEAAARDEASPSEPVIGIAFDGTGAGGCIRTTPREDTAEAEGRLEADGTIWGGEFLVSTLTGCERIAHLRPWRLPGGAASVRDPRRNAFSLLTACGLLEHPGAKPLLASLAPEEQTVTATMIKRGINSPLTSSMGRLLDACAALLGICTRATYEGEPAILLEAAATRAMRRGRSAGMEDAATRLDGPHPDIIDPAPLLSRLLSGIAAGEDPGALALLVHHAIARATVDQAAAIARRTGVRTVALSGGVFMNRILLEGISRLLRDQGLAVLIPHELPFNDGCIAYGQAAVARAILSR